MNVKVRLVVAVILVAFFAVELCGLAVTATTASWNLIPEWERILLLFSILVELCGALLAFWAYEDRKKIERLWYSVFEPQERREEE